MFIQATAGVDVDPDELAVENGPAGENNPELENKDVGGGENNVNKCKILQFCSCNINFITIIAF